MAAVKQGTMLAEIEEHIVAAWHHATEHHGKQSAHSHAHGHAHGHAHTHTHSHDHTHGAAATTSSSAAP